MSDATPEQMAWVEKELLRLQGSSAISQVASSSHISRMFLVPKPDK